MKFEYPSFAIQVVIAKSIALAAFLVYFFHAPIEVSHQILEILHVVYESIAYVLELGLHHAFHLNKFESQLVVFYFSWIVGLFVLYRLCLRLPGFLEAFKQRLTRRIESIKTVCLETWEHSSWFQRIKLMLIQMGLLAGTIMFVLS